MKSAIPRKRVVLITGGSGGLGRALCQIFSTAGDTVCAHFHRNKNACEKTIRALKKAGGESALFSADLQDSKSVQRMMEKILKRWEKVDLLINSAAITGDILFSRMEEGEWDQVIGVNLSGVFFCMREAGRAMVEKGEGHIINISSYAAYTGRVGQASYTASKRGLIALTQSAAKEWGRSGVQVNAVLPGYLPTPMTASLPPVEKKRMIQENTLDRPSTLEEVSRFIFDLSRMKHVSGQVFNLDSRILPFF